MKGGGWPEACGHLPFTSSTQKKRSFQAAGHSCLHLSTPQTWAAISDPAPFPVQTPQQTGASVICPPVGPVSQARPTLSVLPLGPLPPACPTLSSLCFLTGSPSAWKSSSPFLCPMDPLSCLRMPSQMHRAESKGPPAQFPRPPAPAPCYGSHHIAPAYLLIRLPSWTAGCRRAGATFH